MEKFLDYFRRFDGNFITLYRDVVKHGIEKEKIHENGKRQQALELMYDDETICKALAKECTAILDHPEKMFDMVYHLVLKKRIYSCEEMVREGEITLKDIEHDLNTRRRHIWRINDCKFHILSLLMYQKTEEEWIKELKDEFVVFEEKEMKEEAMSKNSNLENWGDEKRHLLLDDKEWDLKLYEFNRKKEIELEKVSFDVFIMKEQNKLRKERRELMKKEELERRDHDSQTGEIEEEIRKKKDEIEAFRGQKPLIKRKLNLISGKLESVKNRKGEDSSMYIRLKKFNSRLGEKLVNMNNQIAEIEKEIEALHEKLKMIAQGEGIVMKSEALKMLEKRILDCVPENYTNEQREMMFEYKPERRAYIEEHLMNKLRWFSEKGMSEFVVKLVISIKSGYSACGVNRDVMRYVDKFYTPSFYKWGIIRSKVMLSSIGMDWFSDSLAMVTDLQIDAGYDEVIAIDCFCPIIANEKTLENQLLQLAETIVKANVNYQYSLCNIWGEDVSYNSMEFALKVIESLDYTEFFPVVEKYLNEMRETLEKMDGQVEAKFRFVTVSRDFKRAFFNKKKKKKKRKKKHEMLDSFGDLNKKGFIDDERFQPDQRNRIKFLTHKDLDDFYRLLYEIDIDFEAHHPGYHQLLKGFDRAFWMRYLRANDNSDQALLEKTHPTDHYEGCPFNQGEKAVRLEYDEDSDEDE